VFVTGRGSLMSLIVRAAGHLLIARKPPAPSFDILKSDGCHRRPVPLALHA
jgi:hypothetical protein